MVKLSQDLHYFLVKVAACIDVVVEQEQVLFEVEVVYCNMITDVAAVFSILLQSKTRCYQSSATLSVSPEFPSVGATLSDSFALLGWYLCFLYSFSHCLSFSDQAMYQFLILLWRFPFL